MNSYSQTLYQNLMNLCESTDSFYFIDHTVNDNHYRVFTYRLASFMDFQKPSALECRGHTFLITKYGPTLVSLPMNKFFNYDEHIGWGKSIDLSGKLMIQDKLDGSLISTVSNMNGILLKSKTSFTSEQATDATNWLNSRENERFKNKIQQIVAWNHTVNFEWTSPNNTIVIGYPEPRLTVLNVRSNADGSYLPYEQMIDIFENKNVVSLYDPPSDPYRFIEDIRSAVGIEGVIIYTNSGLIVKHKTDAYTHTHRFKDSVTNDRKLFELCLNETTDDARSLFVNDPIIIERINNMEQRVSKIYNSIHKDVYSFYEDNKDLSRKDYAIKGREMLDNSIFPLAMNLYLDKLIDIKINMVKNFKNYGIDDTSVEHE